MNHGTLGTKAMLVQLTIGTWSAEREDRSVADAVAAKHGSDPRMGKFKRYLVDPDSLIPINKLRNEARTRHYELTLPWGDDGSRIISSAGFMRYRYEMQQFAVRFQDLADRFTDVYPALIQSARVLLNGLFNSQEYPSQETMRDRFRYKTKFLPVPESDDFRVDINSEDAAIIREQLQSDVDSQLESAMSDVVSRIRGPITHLATRLTEYGAAVDKGEKARLHTSVMANVQQMVDILPALNITGNAHIASILKECRAAFSGTDVGLLKDSNHARSAVIDAANSIVAKMADYGL